MKNLIFCKLFFLIAFIVSTFIFFSFSSYAETCANDPQADPCWVQKSPMPVGESGFGISSDLSGKIYIVGGYDGSGDTNNFFMYDSNLNTWVSKNKPPVGNRRNMGFTFNPISGKFYLAGGFEDGSRNNLYEYDPLTDTWTEKASMHIARESFGLVAGLNGKLYAISGLSNDTLTREESVEEYNPSENTWNFKASILTPRAELNVITAPNGKIYAIGGHIDNNGSAIPSAIVEEYNTNENIWASKSPIPTGRSDAGASLNFEGNIYVVGGITYGLNGGIPYSTTQAVEEYNPLTNTWETKTNFPISVRDVGVALSSFGKVYAMGGISSNGTVYNTNYAGFVPDVSISLNVPVFKQNDPMWGGQEYDNASRWSPSNSTISAWGCALTSAAMVFKYHRINKLPDGTDLDPGTLNSWLKKQKDGYVGNGLLNWLALARLSKLAKNINNLNYDALEYKRKNGYNPDELTNNINDGLPGILAEPGHFVVGKGISGSTFSINDPYYPRTSLSEYGYTFTSLGTYTPSNTDLSYIMLVVNSGIDISLTGENADEGTVITEGPIDNAEGDGQSGEVNIFYLPQPDSENYNIQLSSDNEQEYSLSIYLYDQDGNVFISGKVDTIGSEETINIPLNFNTQLYPTVSTYLSTLLDLEKDSKIKDGKLRGQLTQLLVKAKMQDLLGIEESEIESLNQFLNLLIENQDIIPESAYETLLYDANYLSSH